MPALSDTDQKRLSGYGLPHQVEDAVAEVWNQRFEYGGTGEIVSFTIIAAAVLLIVCDSFPAFAPSKPMFVTFAWILCSVFSVLGALMLSVGSDRRRPDVDSLGNRKLYLSKNVLGHVFATGWRKRIGSIATGGFVFSLVSTGNWFAAFGYLFGTFVLVIGMGFLEIRTKEFLSRLEEKLCYVEVWPAYGSQVFKGETIEGECVRIA